MLTLKEESHHAREAIYRFLRWHFKVIFYHNFFQVWLYDTNPNFMHWIIRKIRIPQQKTAMLGVWYGLVVLSALPMYRPRRRSRGQLLQDPEGQVLGRWTRKHHTITSNIGIDFDSPPKMGTPGIPTTIKTMGVNITTIVYVRVLIIQIGSTIILMVVEAQGTM